MGVIKHDNESGNTRYYDRDSFKFKHCFDVRHKRAGDGLMSIIIKAKRDMDIDIPKTYQTQLFDMWGQFFFDGMHTYGDEYF